MTGLQNKNESDLNTLRKQLLHSETKLEADKQAYITYSRILLETERNLFNAKTVRYSEIFCKYQSNKKEFTLYDRRKDFRVLLKLQSVK